MNLPTLPSPQVSYAKCSWAYTAEQMQAHYQKGRCAGLEEAARICHGIATAPSNVVLGVAMECYEKIRSLK